MELNYKALANIAKEKAKHDAKLCFPDGKLQDDMAKRLADKYYYQFVTPPISK